VKWEAHSLSSMEGFLLVVVLVFKACGNVKALHCVDVKRSRTCRAFWPCFSRIILMNGLILYSTRTRSDVRVPKPDKSNPVLGRACGLSNTGRNLGSAWTTQVSRMLNATVLLERTNHGVKESFMARATADDGPSTGARSRPATIKSEKTDKVILAGVEPEIFMCGPDQACTRLDALRL
jgi:hypothetical protein